MTIRVRPATADDQTFLATMLVEAAYPPWATPPPTPEQALADRRAGRFLRQWGRAGDLALIGEDRSGNAVGAAWYRRFSTAHEGSGFVAADIPELAIAVVRERRSAGVGSALLAALIEIARETGERALSLTVSAQNPVALRLYRPAGFLRVAGDDAHPVLLLEFRPLSALVAWLSDQLRAQDPTARRVAILADEPERAVAAYETRRFGSVVAKVNRDGNQSAREATALRAARRTSAPVPAVFAAVGGSPAMLILASIPGACLGPASTAAAWRAAGAGLRLLHETLTAHLPELGDPDAWRASLGQEIDRQTDGALGAGTLTPDEAARVAEWLRDRLAGTVAAVLLHGDCAAEHFLLEDDELTGIVDLGDARFGDAVFDLAVLTLWQPERLADVLVGYEAPADLRGRIDALLPAFTMLRLLGAANWLRDHGYEPARHEDRVRREVAALTTGDVGRR